ncbi:pentapeptide repeat-containing protein [Streptomyces sp. NBC_00400]|uniref:pentapeptide repeat-containing protein n=1 Tax=Streptomyces sp. NBC_00400 TaxID=2975737 RepID=UPI002E245287
MSARTKRIVVTAALALLVIGYALLLWRGPWWIDGSHLREQNLQPADGVVITGFRTTLVALGAGAVAALGLWYTHRNHELSQSQFEQTKEQFTLAQRQFEHTQDQFQHTQAKDREEAQLSREGQVTERYVEAIKLLGSENATERLGGIYSLERIMRDSEKDHATTVEVLAAFTRSAASPLKPARPAFQLPAARPLPRESKESNNKGVTVVDFPAPLAEDIQAAITVLGRRPARMEEPSINLHVDENIEGFVRGAKLARATLRDGRFNGAHLKYANLESADLTRAKFKEANLSGAKMRRARLRMADLRKANLSGADLKGANLRGADLTGADLSGADLAGADLLGAKLAGAEFFFADLEETNFAKKETRWSDPSDERIEDAALAQAEGITVKHLEHAFIYGTTKLPHGLANEPAIQANIEKTEARRASTPETPKGSQRADAAE